MFKIMQLLELDWVMFLLHQSSIVMLKDATEFLDEAPLRPGNVFKIPGSRDSEDSSVTATFIQPTKLTVHIAPDLQDLSLQCRASLPERFKR